MTDPEELAKYDGVDAMEEERDGGEGAGGADKAEAQRGDDGKEEGAGMCATCVVFVMNACV